MVEGLPALLTVEEAAEHLRIGRTKAYAMAREWRDTGGRAGLPVVDFGNVLRVPRHALEELIGTELGGTAGRVPAEEPTRADPTVAEPTVVKPAPQAPETPAAATPTRRPATRRNRARASSNQLNLFGSPPPAA